MKAQCMESVKSLNRLTLSQAIKTSQLQQFAEEQEALGMGPIEGVNFDKSVVDLLIEHQSPDQTFGSPLRDDLSGKKTR